MKKPIHTPGRFVWREAMTRDVTKAKRFYGELFAWKFEDYPTPTGEPYRLIHAGPRTIGGLMAMDATMTLPSAWVSYVSVPDVRQACDTATKLGGTVAFGPVDVPEVGALATLLDPEGACFALMTSLMDDPPADERPGPGTFCWETLRAQDVGRATAFYTKVLPWTFAEGPEVSTFAVGEGMENQVADLEKAESGAMPRWLTYVVVAKLEDSVRRVEALGGAVVMGPAPAGDFGRFAIVRDDQGAEIGLFEPRSG